MNFRYNLQNLHRVIFDRFLAPSPKLISDAPKCTRKLLSNFLTVPNSSTTVKVIDKRDNSFGQVILVTYSDLVPQKAID